MTSKSGVKRAGLPSPPASTSSAQHPPLSHHLIPHSKISASYIPLVPGFNVHYAVLAPRHTAQSHVDIDLARRKLHENNTGKQLQDSLLSYTQLTREEAALWVFRMEQPSAVTNSTDFLSFPRDLEFNGLIVKLHDNFSYEDLYPCSITCSVQRRPCSTCKESYHSGPHGRTTGQPSGRPMASYYPRFPLREPLAFFLRAIQEHIINDISSDTRVPGTVTRRFGTGFLWGPADSSGHWGDGWDQHWKTRSLYYCHFESSLFPSGILLHPHFQPTHFLPFLSSLPLAPGTPINLLPFSTPAYYLNMYSGSTSALLRQFQANFVGLGVGKLSPSMVSTQDKPTSETTVPFAIVWISVQNRQGEDKGMILIWPAPLCVSLMSVPEKPDDPDSPKMYAYNRRPLSYIPELPLALQPSPVPAPAIVPAQPRAFSPHDSLVSPSLFTPVGRISFSREATPTTPFPPRSATHSCKAERDPDRPPLIHAASSFSTSTAQAFRTLSISNHPSQNIRNVAEGVGKFVDSIAKERERERERIKREKEREASVFSTQAQTQSLASKGVGTPQSPGVAPPNTSPSILGTLHTAGVLDTGNSAPGPTQILSSITLNKQVFSNPPQPQIQQPPPSSSNPSYPSPPEEASKTEQAVSVENASTTVAQKSQSATAEQFNSFVNMDMMDFGDFNMALPSSTDNQGENIRMDFESFDVFTDADFSFFDDPAAPQVNALTAGVPETNGLTANEAIKSMATPTSGHDDIFLQTTTPGPAASLFSIDKSSPLDTSKPRPKSGTHTKEHGEFTIPELLPGSPDGSTASSNGPATPEVIPTMDAETSSLDISPFGPIRFSKRFNSVDAKYAKGKFSRSILERDNSADAETSLTTLLKMSYDSVTDPRVEIVKKLAGIKRRLAIQGMRLGSPCPPLQVTRSEWESCMEDGVSAADVDSEQDSDEEDQNLDDYDRLDSVSRPSTPLASHLPLGPTLISTQFQHSLLLPLSVNLRPPGASFAATLDLASPLPNPVPTPVSPAAVAGSRSEKLKALEIAVRRFVLEVVENAMWERAWRAAIVNQAPIWRDVESEQDAAGCFLPIGRLGDNMDVKTFSSLVKSASEGESSRISSLALKPLEQPMFTIGKADVLINMLPTALRFWSKMGLTPRSGPKDVTAFVLYEDDIRPFAEVERWINRVSCIYATKGYGTHSLGKSSMCSRNGFVPIRYTTFRKASTTLLDSLGTLISPLVIYAVIPSYLLSFSSPILRQLYQSISRLLSSREHDDVPICFQVVPDFLLSFKDDITAVSLLETFVDNVYNRIPRPIDRLMSRPLFDYNKKMRKHFEAPSFTLARSSVPSASLSFQHPPPELSPFERGVFLHIGYKLSKCRKWLIAACIDQRGESHELGVWLEGEDVDYKQIVGQVWSFLVDFGKRASVEWRVAVTKLGTIDEAEFSAWDVLLNDKTSNRSQAPPMHVSLLCVDDESGWSMVEDGTLVLQSQKTPSSVDSHGKGIGHHIPSQGLGQGSGGGAQGQGQLFTSMNSTYIIPSLRCPLSSGIAHDLGAAQHIPEEDDSTPRLPTTECLRPLLSSVLITVPSSSSTSKAPQARAQYIHLLQSSIPITSRSATSTSTSASPLTKTPEENLDDICRNYHELGVLTQARWPHLNLRRSTILPYHLAALRLVDSTIQMSDVLNGSE